MAPRGERIEDAALPEHRLLDRAVVGQHGDHHLAVRGIAGRVGERRALADQGLGLLGRAVINGQRMTRGQQIGRHAASHASNADETDLHR